MNTLLGQTFICSFLTVAPLQASVFQVVSIPLSERVFSPVDKDSVRLEVHQPFDQWSRAVWDQNASMFEDMTVKPTTNILIEALEDDRPNATIAQFCDRARAEAAWTGANMVFMAETRKNAEGDLTSVRFIAYRAEYQQTLLSPYQLASLGRMPVASSGNPASSYVSDSAENELFDIAPGEAEGMIAHLSSFAGHVLAAGL